MSRSVSVSALVFVFGLAACSGSSSSPRTDPSPASGPAPSVAPPATVTETAQPADAPPPLDISLLGQPCGEDGLCLAGTCERYYGIAGAKGPELSSCEIRCSNAEPCPTGTRCLTIADGPGEVCRP